MSLSYAVRMFGIGILMAATSTAAAIGETYDRYGVSGQDVAEYAKVAATIPSCAAARSADPEPAHPTDNPQVLLHVATLYGQCADVLQKRHAPPGVMRTNGLYLGFKCSVLGSATGAAVSVSACSARPAPAPST